MLDFTNASILPGTLRQRSHPTPGIGDRSPLTFSVSRRRSVLTLINCPCEAPNFRLEVTHARFRKTTRNGKSKLPPAAPQPAGDFQRDAKIVSEMSAAGVLSVVVGTNLKMLSDPPASRFIATIF